MSADIAVAKLNVREAHVSREREAILRLLKDFLTADIDEHRLEWLYFANPHGSARVWLLEDGSGLIGAGAVIPKKLWTSRSRIPGCVFGDFCVSPSCRSVGPALQLQRACLQAVSSGWSELAYDLPSASMLAVYRRLKITADSSLVRMAKPLRLERQMRSRLKSTGLSKVAGKVGSMVLTARDRVRATDRNIEVRKHEEAFGDEFNVLFENVASKLGNWVIERSSAYLDWRFRRHPKTKYTMWTARRNGRLEAYAVTQEREQDIQVVDLFGADAPGLLETLLLSVADSVRRGQFETLSLAVLSGHRWQERLVKTGFFPRESSPLVVCGGQTVSGAPGWLTDGDRDS